VSSPDWLRNRSDELRGGTLCLRTDISRHRDVALGWRLSKDEVWGASPRSCQRWLPRFALASAMQETRRRELLRLIEKHISFASVRHSAKSKKEDVFRPGPENRTGESEHSWSSAV
jgi:hypothetical protein